MSRTSLKFVGTPPALHLLFNSTQWRSKYGKHQWEKIITACVCVTKIGRQRDTGCVCWQQNVYLKNSLERTPLEVRKDQTGFLGMLQRRLGRCVFPLASWNEKIFSHFSHENTKFYIRIYIRLPARRDFTWHCKLHHSWMLEMRWDSMKLSFNIFLLRKITQPASILGQTLVFFKIKMALRRTCCVDIFLIRACFTLIRGSNRTITINVNKQEQ